MSSSFISLKLNEKVTNFKVILNDTTIKANNNVKYLGIMVDTNLNFCCHLEVIEHNRSRAVGILCKWKPVLPQKPLLKLYYSLIHHHLLYSLVAWGLTFPSYLTKLSSLQNNAIKLIDGRTYRDDATPYYLEYIRLYQYSH